MDSIDDILKDIQPDDGGQSYMQQVDTLLEEAGEDKNKKQAALLKVTYWLNADKNPYSQQDNIKSVAKKFGYSESTIKKALKELRESIILSGDDEAPLPAWVDKDKFYAQGWVQLFEEQPGGFKVGIYFKVNNETRPKRVTNYCIVPIAHIHGNDSRRLVEITHVYKKSVVELSDNAMVNEAAFSKEIISRGPFRKEPGFTAYHYSSIISAVIDDAKEVQELTTLGWNPNGFFSFSNLIGMPGTDPTDPDGTHRLIGYNSYGLAEAGSHTYYSPSVSSANSVGIGDENMYENDLYLKFVKAPITFGEWAILFTEVYGERGRLGMAFLFITLFKDIVVTVTKCPHLYCYGPKDSGKSAMCESIMRFVFSGKDSSGQPIQGYNVSRGMGTPFSFHNGNERFRNTPRILNEFDINNSEDYVRGAIKAAYDGEARQVGDGNSYKKKKTRSQKVLCTLMVIGQYLDTSDDGSIPSRSIIPAAFSLQENKARTKRAESLFFKLRDYEQEGLSSLVLDMLVHRDHVAKNLKRVFAEVKEQMAMDLLEKKRVVVEQRISNNYSLCLAMIRLMGEKVNIPFSYDEFYHQVQETIVKQNSLIKDSSILTIFWKICEILFAEGEIHDRKEFKITTTDKVSVKVDGQVKEMKLDRTMQVLFIRFDWIHVKFAKMYYDKYKKPAPNEPTMIAYLKEQSYFVGLCPGTHFADTKTSAYMLNYEKIGVNLEKEFDNEEAVDKAQAKKQEIDQRNEVVDPNEQLRLDKEFDEFNNSTK